MTTPAPPPDDEKAKPYSAEEIAVIRGMAERLDDKTWRTQAIKRLLATLSAARAASPGAWRGECRSVLGNNGPGPLAVHLRYGIGDAFTQHEDDCLLSGGERLCILSNRLHDALVYGGVVPLSPAPTREGA